MPKICLDAGHCSTGAAAGAAGNGSPGTGYYFGYLPANQADAGAPGN